MQSWLQIGSMQAAATDQKEFRARNAPRRPRYTRDGLAGADRRVVRPFDLEGDLGVQRPSREVSLPAAIAASFSHSYQSVTLRLVNWSRVISSSDRPSDYPNQ